MSWTARRLEKKLRKAVAKAKQAAEAGGDTSPVIQALTELANHHRDNAQWDELTEAVEERHALQRQAGQFGPGLIYLAGTLAENGRPEQALALLARVDDELSGDGIGESSSERATFYSIQAEVFMAVDRLDDAIGAIRKQVAIARQHPQYSDYWEMQAYLASLLQFQQRDHAAAAVERTELWEHFRHTLSKGPLSYNAIMVHVANGAALAHAHRELGATAQAIPVYKALLQDLAGSDFFGDGTIETFTLMIELGECYRDTDDPASAREWVGKADDWRRDHDGDDPQLRERLEALRSAVES
ncbi:MAG: hypothetical protein Tsb0020_09270 [Haliangiales bacterium]